MNAPSWKESLLLQTPARFVLGGVMLLASYMKLFDRVWAGNDPTLSFAEAIKGYHLLDIERHHHIIELAAYAIPWTELLVGFMLVLGFWTRPAAFVSLVMLAGFTVANTFVVLEGTNTSCACFGSLEWPCGDSITWCQIVRNSLFMVMAGYLAWRGAGLLALEAPGSGTKSGPAASA